MNEKLFHFTMCKCPASFIDLCRNSVCVSVCLCLSLCMFLFESVCLCVNVCVCVRERERVCVCVCSLVRLCVSLLVTRVSFAETTESVCKLSVCKRVCV